MKNNLNQEEVNIIIQDLIGKVKRLRGQNTKLNKLNKLTQSAVKKQLKQIEQLTSNNNKLESIVNDKDEKAKDLNKKISDLKEGAAKIISLENDNSKNLKTINDLQNKQAVLNKEVRQLASKLSNANEINTKLISERKKVKEELSARSSRKTSRLGSGISKPPSLAKGPKEDYLYRHYKNNYNKGDMVTANVYNEMSMKIHGVNLHNKYNNKLKNKEENQGMFGIKKYKRIKYG